MKKLLVLLLLIPSLSWGNNIHWSKNEFCGELEVMINKDKKTLRIKYNIELGKIIETKQDKKLDIVDIERSLIRRIEIYSFFCER